MLRNKEVEREAAKKKRLFQGFDGSDVIDIVGKSKKVTESLVNLTGNLSLE